MGLSIWLAFSSRARQRYRLRRAYESLSQGSSYHKRNPASLEGKSSHPTGGKRNHISIKERLWIRALFKRGQYGMVFGSISPTDGTWNVNFP
jgi:hypothetical protein